VDDQLQRAVNRRIVDPTGPVVVEREAAAYTPPGKVGGRQVRPMPAGSLDILPPSAPAYRPCPASNFCTKFVHVSTNKIRCSVNAASWTPGGRRLLTGCHSGEFTLWNGMCFNFETIIQAHDKPLRSMAWSHNKAWLITGDDGGIIQYWTPTLNKAKRLFDAHKEAVRGLSFAPTDLKFASCSDDTTVKVWDFASGKVSHAMNAHGGDVKSVEWHPSMALIASGSKDSLVKLWDPRQGSELATVYGHKNTVNCVRWNKRGDCLLSGSRDQVLKLFDLRTLREMETYRAQSKDVTNAQWHPEHEDMFVSASSDGTINFWLTRYNKPMAVIKGAHESAIWGLAWHPVGHVLVSTSQDNTTKFWARNRPGDMVRDKGGDVRGPGEPAYTAPPPGKFGKHGSGVIPGLG